MTVKYLASHWLHKPSCSSPHFVPCQPHASSTPPMPPPDSLFDLWRKSRSTISREGRSYSLGAQRPLNRETFSLATKLAQLCAPQMSAIFWSLHPWRALLTVVFGFLRGLLPVFKGYSHALIIDEIQALIGSTDIDITWHHLLRLLSTEVLRLVVEHALDTFAANNEQVLQAAARFLIEYKQLETRVSLDVTMMSDSVIRDLLAESDMFVSSFQGVGGGFGLLSPFDFIRVFTLLSEILSNLYVLYSLTSSHAHSDSESLSLFTLAFSILSCAYPYIQSYLFPYRHRFDIPSFGEEEARNAEVQERMRHLSTSESHRPEVMLFGLGPWILDTWANARRASLGLRSHPQARTGPRVLSNLLLHINGAEVITSLQNIPMILMLQSSTSLGSLALYRNSIHSIVQAFSSLWVTLQMTIQGVFLMGAFWASVEVGQSRLNPKPEDQVPYVSRPGGGMRIEAQDLSYTYPGSPTPALHHVNFTLEPGETLALVGRNGSGKSTLAKILLRIIDFHSGSLTLNDTSIRLYNPSDLHRVCTAIFQQFSRYNGTVTDNVGVGRVEDMRSDVSGTRDGPVRRAIRLAEGEEVVDALPKGLETVLDAVGFDAMGASGSQGSGAGYGAYTGPGMMGVDQEWMPHGLSGGEASWQRIALARAFMRAHRPEVDLLLFDEPTSSLDSHAQRNIFDTLDRISRSGGEDNGRKTKTTIFITHRLSTARRADKIAMMEHGAIIEFGTHEELLDLGGAYALLYHASV
ncbi:P-loop containing nucleoside triphosphate hydrolase protein [Stereum hirsutum FP-91666 SS1]|uniref:P-loop containing nucleoside triphosphate hydrolase protein n=1 Tax=Stereum hirsutum (strain FP-91666) TaxID=721885 RepID=UPI000444A2E6|nr:P-loop containing nucleoside triphosphate hydrolase protein [Stereum hirsutum FP-91666 SS1]EIM85550.1 P-loop containing nucleoside triphosphate hydrolase protein [Stereum hirsutum FP-91666 SS1]